ncbi:MAG: phosphopantothenate/pantothenate synthetase, partial [Salinirussus sp.]
YLLGEKTIPSADEAERAAAAHLLLAQRPVLSVNGNAAALVPGELVELAEAVDAALEVNLFHRSEDRVRAIANHLRDHGATEVLGLAGDARIPGLDHDRAQVDADGIYVADVVLVPLEDGDRAAALSEMGKTEIVVDLNPLSRSAQVAAVPIIDNVVRAIPGITAHVSDLVDTDQADLEKIIEDFDPDATRADAEKQLRSGGSLEDR